MRVLACPANSSLLNSGYLLVAGSPSGSASMLLALAVSSQPGAAPCAESPGESQASPPAPCAIISPSPGSDARWQRLFHFQRLLRASHGRAAAASRCRGQDQTCHRAGVEAVTGAPGLPALTGPPAPRPREDSLGSPTEGVTAAGSPPGPAVAGCDPCPVSSCCLPGSNIKGSRIPEGQRTRKWG